MLMLINLEKNVKFGEYFQSILGDPFKWKAPNLPSGCLFRYVKIFAANSIPKSYHKYANISIKCYNVILLKLVNQLNVKFAHDYKSKFNITFFYFLNRKKWNKKSWPVRLGVRIWIYWAIFIVETTIYLHKKEKKIDFT